MSSGRVQRQSGRLQQQLARQDARQQQRDATAQQKTAERFYPRKTPSTPLPSAASDPYTFFIDYSRKGNKCNEPHVKPGGGGKNHVHAEYKTHGTLVDGSGNPVSPEQLARFGVLPGHVELGGSHPQLTSPQHALLSVNENGTALEFWTRGTVPRNGSFQLGAATVQYGNCVQLPSATPYLAGLIGLLVVATGAVARCTMRRRRGYAPVGAAGDAPAAAELETLPGSGGASPRGSVTSRSAPPSPVPSEAAGQRAGTPPPALFQNI